MGYELLYLFEDMAIESLPDVAETAKEMATAAETMQRDFEQQSKKLIHGTEATQKTQQSKESKKKELEMKKVTVADCTKKSKEVLAANIREADAAILVLELELKL